MLADLQAFLSKDSFSLFSRNGSSTFGNPAMKVLHLCWIHIFSARMGWFPKLVVRGGMTFKISSMSTTYGTTVTDGLDSSKT
jgi:hypothetical protein